MAKSTYNDQMRKQLEQLIGDLGLAPLQERYLRDRWLDQVLWMEGRAAQAQLRYHVLRLVTIVGGVLVPAAVSLDTQWSRALAIVVGLLVAVSAAVEEFFHYGERWRHYRRTVEVLKTEGWRFFQLAGAPYQGKAAHADAYPDFVERVESLLGQDVKVFITEVAKEKAKTGQKEAGGA